MMQKKKASFLEILGIGLILCSAVLLLFQHFRAHTAVVSAKAVVFQMEELMPERTAGIPGIYADPAMPVLELDGEDFSCLLDVPAFGVTLPVGNSWDTGKLGFYPCRFWGSVNDCSLVIGGTDQQGQFDFCGKIDLGTVITVTDMTGAEFTYSVTRVDRANQADADWLCSEAYDLTLFARAKFSLEYIAVRCSLSSRTSPVESVTTRNVSGISDTASPIP